MKKVLLFCLIALSAAGLHAQEFNVGSDYQTSIGVKVYPGAVTVKHFLKPTVAVKGWGIFHPMAFVLQVFMNCTIILAISKDSNGISVPAPISVSGAITGKQNTLPARQASPLV